MTDVRVHNTYIYIYIYIVAWWLECSPMARETWVQYQRLKKWYLIPPCLILSIIRYGSRVKWSNPGKGVAPFRAPWCSSYREGSFRVTIDRGHQLYLLSYISYQYPQQDRNKSIILMWLVFVFLKEIIALWCQLHWALYQENLNVHCWMFFVLMELFLSPV